MKLTSDELKSLYQEETSRSALRRNECLTAEEMMRAATGKLSAAERERVTDHLPRCSDCTQEFRLAHELKPWAESVAEPGRSAPAMRLFAAGSQTGFNSQPGARQHWSAIFMRNFGFGLPIAVLFISLALGLWSISWRRERGRSTDGLKEQLKKQNETITRNNELLAEAQRQADEANRRAEQYQRQVVELNRAIEKLSQAPSTISGEMNVPPPLVPGEPNVPIVDLEPDNVSRGSGDTMARVKLPAGNHLFILILHVDGRPSYPGFSLEVLDARGQRIWKAQEPRQNQDNTFTVALSRRAFPAGQYEIELRGLRAGKSELIGDYKLRIDY